MQEFNSKRDLSNYWYNRSLSLRDGALHLYDVSKGKVTELTNPCLLLAGLSIEVIAKAVLIKIEQKFDEEKYARGHKLEKILKKIELNFSDDQMATLEILEESVIWLSKYPVAKGGKKSSAADKMFKRLPMGKFGQVLTPDHKRWPNKDVYLEIWDIFHSHYFNTPTENPNEFGYLLKGIER